MCDMRCGLTQYSSKEIILLRHSIERKYKDKTRQEKKKTDDK